MGSRSRAGSLAPKNEVREVTMDWRAAGRRKGGDLHMVGRENSEKGRERRRAGTKMPGLNREEVLGEGKPSPWSGKFWVEGRLFQQCCVR